MADAPAASGILRSRAPQSPRDDSAWEAARSALLSRTDPFLRDDAEAFFFKDAVIRLGRLVETSIALSIFVFFVYRGTILPVVNRSVYWLITFFPLLVLDIRGIQFTLYLWRNRAHFAELDWVQHLIIAMSEFMTKVALYGYIISPQEQRLPLSVIMLPYELGYVLHLILGYCVQPAEDLVRPEGCNSVAWLMSEFVRLILFIFAIMVSLKADHPTGLYPWQAAFWPAWAIDIISTLIAILLLPVCILAIFRKSPKALILCWLVPRCGLFAIVLSVLLWSMGKLLSYAYCPEDEEGEQCRSVAWCTWKGVSCATLLSVGLLPLGVFFTLFGLYTLCLKRLLAVSLHSMWYHAPQQQETEVADVTLLPTPKLMFRITATYFSRQYIPEEDGSLLLSNSGSIGPSQSASQAPSRNGSFFLETHHNGSLIRDTHHNGSLIRETRHNGSLIRKPSRNGSFIRGDQPRSGSLGPLKVPCDSSGSKVPSGVWAMSPNTSVISIDPLTAMSQGASFVSLGGTKHHRDHAGSVLSARGSAYCEIVEDENLCFVCYASVPNAILLECGHAGMCVDCALRMMDRDASSCPICRTAIAQVLRICAEKPPQHLFGNMRHHRSSSGSSASGMQRVPKKARMPFQGSEQPLDVALDVERLGSTTTEGDTEDFYEDLPRAQVSLVPPMAGTESQRQLPSDSWGDQPIADCPREGSWENSEGGPRYPAAAHRTAFLVDCVRCLSQPGAPSP